MISFKKSSLKLLFHFSWSLTKILPWFLLVSYFFWLKIPLPLEPPKANHCFIYSSSSSPPPFSFSSSSSSSSYQVINLLSFLCIQEPESIGKEILSTFISILNTFVCEQEIISGGAKKIAQLLSCSTPQSSAPPDVVIGSAVLLFLKFFEDLPSGPSLSLVCKDISFPLPFFPLNPFPSQHLPFPCFQISWTYGLVQWVFPPVFWNLPTCLQLLRQGGKKTCCKPTPSCMFSMGPAKWICESFQMDHCLFFPQKLFVLILNFFLTFLFLKQSLLLLLSSAGRWSWFQEKKERKHFQSSWGFSARCLITFMIAKSWFQRHQLCNLKNRLRRRKRRKPRNPLLLKLLRFFHWIVH